MRAVDVGIGHDDDAGIAQVLFAVLRAGAAADRLHQIGELRVGGQLVLGGGGDVEDFSAQRENGLGLAVARLLGAAAGRVALDDEQLGAFGGGVGAVGELAGQPQLLDRGLARDFLLGAAAQPLVGALDDEVQQLVGLQGIARQPVVERVLDRLFDDALGFGGGEAVLGLALEFRLAHEHREHHGGAHHDVFGDDAGGALALADALGVILQAAQHRAAHAGFVGAAVLRRHRVAIGRQETVGVGGPGHRPFAGAVGADAAGFAGEDVRMHQGVGMNGGGQIVLQSAGEMKAVLGRHVLEALQQRRDRSASGFRRRRTDRPWSGPS